MNDRPLGLNRAPIAVFAYNRPDKLKPMLDSLRACEGFPESPVVIFVDGPKGDHDAQSVEAVRALVRRSATPNMSWRFRENNIGLRNSIHAGVTELIERYGRIIVFEDDLILSPIAIDYFNSALFRYENVPDVWSIAGYIYDAPSLRTSLETLALPFTHPWGWATWSRAWQCFKLDNRPAPETLRARAFRNAFDMNGLYPFSSQLESSLEGRVNSWFIHWYYTIFQYGGVSIFPARRVLDNYGFKQGAHGGSLNPYDRLVQRPRLLETLPSFNDEIFVDYAALDALKHSRELRVQRFIARAGAAKRRLKLSR